MYTVPSATASVEYTSPPVCRRRLGRAHEVGGASERPREPPAGETGVRGPARRQPRKGLRVGLDDSGPHWTDLSGMPFALGEILPDRAPAQAAQQY